MFPLLAALGCAPDPAPMAPPAAEACAEARAEACTEDVKKWKRAEAILRDWPARGRFKAEAQAPGTVVFVGDSILANWAESPEGFFPGEPYVDRGIKLQTTSQMLVRFRGDAVLPGVAAVLLHGGANDITGLRDAITDAEVVGNLASMAEIATANHIRVIVGTMLPIGPSAEKRRPSARVLAINEGLRALVAEKHYALADFHAALVAPDGTLPDTLSDDGVHPNAAAYARMAPVAKAAIRTALR
ncbi:acylneuraminate cytidylyltransferase [Deltaproteobacteria bacterium]|nr:acylneuraminate cytidylyltransferase [Deltaproteobacteria bacterium]